ncbi:MAG: SDR family NAD(P)-dependent oxidoreductase [Acidobacteria bacterium]|nr:SDR family NAD(P)-dependent oxidoreductase [Acidobacteriota bacterium]MYE42711.1 SDR family NAD(P)-dependent oxidoreductase [Acidobacteriota bacterium]
MMKRALVTGANRGIGLAIAGGLVDRGHEVLLGARNAAAGEKAARRIGGAAVRLDVADPASILRAVDEAGAVDILVNNAGVLGSGGVLDDPEEFAESMAVMVRGPYLLMRHLTPGMVARGYGRVVNVSSGWGAFSEGLGGPGGYGVAKAALNALTVAAARSLPDSVKVNAMCPGWVRTRMGGMGASRSVEEGADTALWLATLGADGPTGGFFRDRKRIDW